MGAKAASEPWVGRPLPRLEDDALLRGEGRFIDDLDPVANTRHAAVLRSPYAHARITRLDPTHALELPGVVGILTGADVAALSRPFPAGIDSPIPHYAAAHETTRYVGEPVAVVVARDRYLAEDALELIEVEYEPLEPVLDAEVAVETAACVSDRSFSYGDVDAALAGADLVVRERFRFRALELHARRVLRRRLRLERRRGLTHGVGELPGPVHAALGRRRRARPPGLEAPPDHAARLGRLLRDQVRRLRIRRPHGPRVAEARRPRPLDRGPPRAPRSQLVVERTRDARRGGVHLRGRARRSALRRDRGRRRIRTRARAGHPLPHARIARGRLPRAERRRTQPRRPHEHDAERAQPRVRRTAALPRARADDDDRREPPRDRPGGAAAA